jgi:SAM-dependent methyltransferase
MTGPRFGALLFRCNICGAACEEQAQNLEREVPSCGSCGSTVRARAVVHMLSTELYGRSVALPDFPVAKHIRGIGLSDSHVYAGRLAERFDYTNTFLDREPRLDITDVDLPRTGTADFVIASDVFEHVSPPVSRAFHNLWRLLKPEGVLLFSAPYTNSPGVTVEHFPDLYDFEILFDTGENPRLRNVTATGAVQFFDDLVFHGGDGQTLEMRVFSEASLIQEFLAAGFQAPRIYANSDFEHGIVWNCNWSLPMAVRP